MLSNPSRDGRRPSSHYSHIMDRIGSITIDDLVKEHVMNGLPMEIRRQLADKADKVSAKELATMADEYFDKEGRPLHSSSSSSVNHVSFNTKPQPQQPRGSTNSSSTAPASGDLVHRQQASTSGDPTPRQQAAAGFTTAFEEGDSEVNAVRFKNGQRQSFDVSNRSSTNASRGRGNGRNRGGNPRDKSTNRFDNSRSNSASSSRNPSQAASGNKVCKFHNRYGDQARTCEPGCMLYSSHSAAAKGQPSQRT